MDELVAFLTACIGEDERRARRLHDEDCATTPPYHSCDCDVPAREYREVAAKRAILARHTPDRTTKYGSPGPPRCVVCLTDREGYEEQWEGDPWPCETVRLLGAVFDGRPGYRQEWRP